MKKNSKKLIVAILVIVCFIVGFNMGASRGRYAVDDAIIEVAKRYTKSTSYDEVNSNVTPLIRVEKQNAGYMGDVLQLSSFSVDTDEQSSCIIVSRLVDNQSTPYNISDIPIFKTHILSTSQSIVFKYIDNSNILKDKESIKKFLSGIQVKCSYFKNDTYKNSHFDSKSNIIYIRPNKVCKSTVINEYINAISYYTHGRKLGEYRYTKLNQIITNLIATGLSRESYHLDYMAYSPLVYPYINLFGDKAIKTYFYGYEDIYKAIPKEEFDFWIAIVDNFDDGFKEYYDDLMLKWYSCNTL